jgi:hypothetical protein
MKLSPDIDANSQFANRAGAFERTSQLGRTISVESIIAERG